MCILDRRIPHGSLMWERGRMRRRKKNTIVQVKVEHLNLTPSILDSDLLAGLDEHWVLYDIPGVNLEIMSVQLCKRVKETYLFMKEDPSIRTIPFSSSQSPHLFPVTFSWGRLHLTQVLLMFLFGIGSQEPNFGVARWPGGGSLF